VIVIRCKIRSKNSQASHLATITIVITIANIVGSLFLLPKSDPKSLMIPQLTTYLILVQGNPSIYRREMAITHKKPVIIKILPIFLQLAKIKIFQA